MNTISATIASRKIATYQDGKERDFEECAVDDAHEVALGQFVVGQPAVEFRVRPGAGGELGVGLAGMGADPGRLHGRHVVAAAENVYWSLLAWVVLLEIA